VALVGEKVVRVECNTCGSLHNYRGEGRKKTTAPRQATASKTRLNKADRLWEELQCKLRPETAIPYNMSTPMQEEMQIQHPSFGLGLVLNCIRPNKMEVQFQSGIKLLRCKLD